MIYRKDEFVQDGADEEEFPIKHIDRMEAIDGSDARYIGKAALVMATPLGAEQIPISFEIEADSIEDAFAKYAEAAKPRIEQVRQQIEQQLQEMRQAQRNRIVTPGEAARGGMLDLGNLRSE